MIVDVTDNDERGQVGIGTLIIFIAMVLVAAVAAGVLINTAGLLESTASDTGQDSQAQVSNQIDVVTAVGENTDGDDAVEILNFTVKKSAGSDNIDLEDATIDYQSDTAQQTLSYGAVANSTHFNETSLKGDDDAVLDDTSERVSIRINVTDVDSALVEGSEATVRFVDQSGATTIYGVNVPDSISGETFVEV
ncbi:archaellin/type IV pilin N-terminal domain-containing protein [Haloarchaeobius iranensis]|uniref:Flagellin n=1 Tax=Haloarchaeobius iranensis TaxID=996166 RepID=A0A1G9ZIH3_9EURY|nr:archaellin/type IV pilin N-terminal domain-containing protein [Haloarchaeobius iranensis]SDN20356.1 flagellin FlaA/flagellin FlaB [Haloarchaeobius iranensis]